MCIRDRAIVFFVLKYTMGLRAHKEEEIAGLDRADFNLVETSYQEFMQIQIDPLEEKFTPEMCIRDSNLPSS